MRFIMKADDDAFVNVPALIAELKSNCITPGCRRERMYFGREIRNNVVRHLFLRFGHALGGRSWNFA